MPGGLRRLRHVIRPGPARAPRLLPLPLRGQRESPRDDGRAPGGSCQLQPLSGRGCCPTAPDAQRPGSARVMPREPPSLPSDIEESGVEQNLYLPESLFARPQSPYSVSLRHHPTGCQMWPWVLNPSEVDRFGVRRAIWATGNNASEMRLGGIGTCGLEDEAHSMDHLFLPGPVMACLMSSVRRTDF